MMAEDYNGFTTGLLLLIWKEAQQRLAEDRKLTWNIEAEIKDRMMADHAAKLAVEGFDVELKVPSDWGREELRPLLEVEGLPDLVQLGAFIPEHDKTTHVPDEWNMTQVKPLAKYGGKAKEIIDRAERQGEPKLTIKAKEG